LFIVQDLSSSLAIRRNVDAFRATAKPLRWNWLQGVWLEMKTLDFGARSDAKLEAVDL